MGVDLLVVPFEERVYAAPSSRKALGSNGLKFGSLGLPGGGGGKSRLWQG